MAHPLIASPYPGGHLVVSPGREGGIKIGVNRYAELRDAAPATPVPGWLAAAALAQWGQDMTGLTSAEAVKVRQETPYGYARASYELNLGCNYDCEHCYLGEKLFDGMEWPERRRLLDVMAEAGVLWLQLTGGEPLVDALFPETLAYAYALGMMVQVSSNGSRLHQPRMIELLTTYRPYRVTLSLYGATEESYDAMTRSRGAFKRFIRGLDAARDAGLTMRINCIVSNRNVHERDAMQALAGRYGIPAFEYTNITPTYHGTGEVLLSQAREVMKRHTPYTGCNAGITHFHADPHGKASICKVGRQQQIDLMTEGAEGLRKLAAIGDRMTTRQGGCAGCSLQKTCGTCMPLATLYRQANAPLGTYCQHGSSDPITANPTEGR